MTGYALLLGLAHEPPITAVTRELTARGADHAVIDQLTAVGIDMSDVTKTLEEEGVASFSKSFDELLTSLETKADALRKE